MLMFGSDAEHIQIDGKPKEKRYDLVGENAMGSCGKVCATLLLAAGLVTGCFTPQKQVTDKHRDFSMGKGELESHGLAFITPSTVTGQQEEKQALALIAAEVLKEKRPEIHCVSLAETLSEVNKAGLADQYKDMYIDYRDTGLFKKDMLKRIGELTGVQYVARARNGKLLPDQPEPVSNLQAAYP